MLIYMPNIASIYLHIRAQQQPDAKSAKSSLLTHSIFPVIDLISHYFIYTQTHTHRHTHTPTLCLNSWLIYTLIYISIFYVAHLNTGWYVIWWDAQTALVWRCVSAPCGTYAPELWAPIPLCPSMWWSPPGRMSPLPVASITRSLR